VTPRWLGWAGVGIGVLSSLAGLAGIVAPDGYNPLAFIFGLVWTLVLSGLLTMRVRRGDADRSETPPARADVTGVG
jgi:hypothetical protein